MLDAENVSAKTTKAASEVFVKKRTLFSPKGEFVRFRKRAVAAYCLGT
jgi:hypothetical protein